MKKITYTITEMQNGEEVDVWETYSASHAYAILLDYTQEDIENLSPCIYKNLPDGERTTEF